MSWRFVFNSGNFGAGTSIDEILDAAFAANYRFFTFNGIVYFVTEKGEAENCGIFSEDLF